MSDGEIMRWNRIQSAKQIQEIRNESKLNPVLVFKHSTRCNISRTALDRLERHWKEEEMGATKSYFLDLINFRDISNFIAEEFGVEHESPQVLIIHDEKAMYNTSHFGIDYHKIKDVINKV